MSAHSPQAETVHRTHVRGSVLLVSGRVIAILTNFLVQIVTVRYLGKSEYGVLAFALSIASVASMACAFGMNKALTRYLPLYLANRDYGRFWGSLAIALGTIGLTGTIAICFFVGHWFFDLGWMASNTDTALVLAIVSGIAFCDAFDALFISLFAVLANPAAIFWRRHLLGPLMRLIAAAIVIAIGGNLYQFATAQVIAVMVGLAISVVLLVTLFSQNARLRVSLRQKRFTLPLGEIFRFSGTLLSNDLSFLLRTALVPIMIGLLFASEAVAEYQAVFPLARLNEFVLISFSILFLPTATRIAAANKHSALQRLYEDTTTWITLLTLPVFSVMLMGADFLPRILFGDQYASSANILSWLALGYFANAGLGTAQRVLHAEGRLRTLLAIDVAMIFIALLFVGALVPLFGAVGGAMAVFAMYVIQAVLYQLAAWRQTEVNPFTGRSLIPFAVGLALCLAGATLRHWLELPPIAGAIGGGIISLIVLAMFRQRLELAGTFPELGRIPLVGRWLTPTTAPSN